MIDQHREERLHGPLAGEVAIVTGGASGIGRATALALARVGARVVVVDVAPAAVETTVAEIAAATSAGRDPASSPTHAVGLVLDVRREADMEAMARETIEAFGGIDILVACAGILRARGTGPKLAVDTSAAEWDEVVDTNLRGVFLSNRAVLPAMIRRRRGSIVNVSSVAGRVGRAYDAAYCASKFGVIGFSEALAEEVRPSGIRVQTILPDAVDTPLLAANGPIPAPAHTLPPERVAGVIVFLLTLPEDTVLINPVVAPFRTRRRKGAGAVDAPAASDAMRATDAPPSTAM
jgi:NAD(P)-dependent dehydrogenase (short-subunit alcohol dehydrogenase family)